jgi:hypothetical protein
MIGIGRNWNRRLHNEQASGVAWCNSRKIEVREGRIMRRSSCRVLLLILILLPATALCDTISVGLISYDVLIPANGNTPGVNVFNISNLTGDPSVGGFALPPDFPVLDSLTFLSLTLATGGPPQVIQLGNLGPGPLSPTDLVQLPDTSLFTEYLHGRDSHNFGGESPVVRRVPGGWYRRSRCYGVNGVECTRA